jgi:hypothetical protein
VVLLVKSSSIREKGEVSFEYCALQYLNAWLERDRAWCEALQTGSTKEKLEVLGSAAFFFRIARNLPLTYDVQATPKRKRYEPVLDIIDRATQADFQGDHDHLLTAIERIRKQIKDRYGGAKGKDVRSATTKFLWLKFKSPIIIFDSRALRALADRKKVKRPCGLSEYYNAWRGFFNDHAGDVNKACAALKEVLDFSWNPKKAREIYDSEISGQRWFKEKVFDIYLWNLGSPPSDRTTKRVVKTAQW